MRRYELMLLLRPDLEEDALQSAVEKVTRAIVNAGGTLTKVSPWGKRRLAYEINHHREASYFLLHFVIQPGEIREIERGMLISEEILRHLVTALEDRPGRAAEDAAIDDEAALAHPAAGEGEVFATDEDEEDGLPAAAVVERELDEQGSGERELGEQGSDEREPAPSAAS